jgi:acyl-CoA synthetase (AMP-forming)/AMP-acid ligase II
MTPIQVLHRRAKVDPKGIAFAAGGRNWSYARLAGQSERVARGLAARGLRKGDRVVLHMPNRPELIVGLYACFHMGAVVVPLNHRLEVVALEPIFQRLRPAFYLGDGKGYSQVETIDSSILPKERRFVAGQTGANKHLQHWESLLSNDASVSLPVASDIHSPAVLLATLERTGVKCFTHTHATVTALFGLPFLCGQ